MDATETYEMDGEPDLDAILEQADLDSTMEPDLDTILEQQPDLDSTFEHLDSDSTLEER